MNIEIANRLVQLRKEHNLSQEELADKLGLSRQAVSKWERAEASPDTDNLICLARLYGVSLDDLLSTDETSEEIKEDVKEKEEAKKESVSIDSSGIHVVDGDESVHIDAKGLKIHINGEDDDDDDYDVYDEDGPKGKVELIFDSIGFVLAAIAYILMGFFWKTADGSSVGWGAGWVVFLLPIVFGSIFAAIRKKNNLSQEDVADKLGISRQSVSKWERAEASPDTDNLISLAKLYNVSLDELLNAEKSNEFVEENKSDEVEEVVIEEEKENDEADTIVESDEKKQGLIGSIISSSIALVVVITYLLLGFLVNDAWYHFWPLFFLIPVVPSFVGAIALKKFTVFAYPVFVTMLLVKVLVWFLKRV
jgi:transcriptional regulator with XRE-family HTH domain